MVGYNVISFRKISFPDLVVDDGGAVDPGVFVFAEESVAAHDVAFEEAVFADGLEHEGGARRLEMASRSVDRRDDILMEADDLLGKPDERREFRGRLLFSELILEVGVFAPGGEEARNGIEGKGEE